MANKLKRLQAQLDKALQCKQQAEILAGHMKKKLQDDHLHVEKAREIIIAYAKWRTMPFWRRLLTCVIGQIRGMPRG